MTKEEIMKRIEKGEEYLERTDLTEEQRTIAAELYERLVDMLGEIDDEEHPGAADEPVEAQNKEPEPEPDESEKIEQHIQTIRETLRKKK